LACSSLCWNLRRERTNDECERPASKIDGVIGHRGENVFGRVMTTLQEPTIRRAVSIFSLKNEPEGGSEAIRRQGLLS
jgi:hypothetical protein